MKVAIAGYGLEGRANLEYFRVKFPEAKMVVFDEKAKLDGVPAGIETVLGAGAFDKIQDFDLVVRTAGLAPRKIAQNNKHWSSTCEFFAECPAPIIGVTGTKGKGSVATMITEILQAHFANSGRKAHLLGNIGTPALDILSRIKPDDTVVYELSSFQLWDLEKSPHVAVVLKIEPDHLDTHTDFADYIAAKSNITRWQNATDTVVYCEQNIYSKQIAELSPGKKIPYPAGISLDFNLNVPGEHNRENAKTAIATVHAMLPEISAATIEKGLTNFHGLPHRLKFVREINGVKFYDDSTATTPGSTIAAVKSFSKPIILIVGGYDKGADYSLLGEVIKQSTVRQIFAIGANREKVAQQISTKARTPIRQLDNQKMSEIVQIINQATEPGDMVILSPAAASFDMFKNIYDRGDQFIAAVEDLPA
ncbi:MAG: UDP-N-acetylmuramoyl-L-alanine--D-glutamate ligase [Candidatus Nomurabacteria bacterium]|jgi:UDP-N-acetylmuramoylalanine--D-glutamate ligase|nr:UDP-N-acetylmuramoyl-L-alanine--D-glutamate ligase [Candidatus Nomurabacteria bacterium]